jgi:hypothetical protein
MFPLSLFWVISNDDRGRYSDRRDDRRDDRGSDRGGYERR